MEPVSDLSIDMHQLSLLQEPQSACELTKEQQKKNDVQENQSVEESQNTSSSKTDGNNNRKQSPRNQLLRALWQMEWKRHFRFICRLVHAHATQMSFDECLDKAKQLIQQRRFYMYPTTWLQSAMSVYKFQSNVFELIAKNSDELFNQGYTKESVEVMQFALRQFLTNMNYYWVNMESRYKQYYPQRYMETMLKIQQQQMQPSHPMERIQPKGWIPKRRQ